METAPRVSAALLVLLAVSLAAGRGEAQQARTLGPANPDMLPCSPAPCILPPTQASEGGSGVTDPSIVVDPPKPSTLLLGSADANCPSPGNLGFHLSRDGGSAWELVECMPGIRRGNIVYWPDGGPSGVGYDLHGNAYIAGLYGDSEGLGYGLVAVQKSTDGARWSDPVVALRNPGDTSPYDTGLTVDAVADSPYANSIYVSGVMGGLPYSGKGQVMVSHSSDGGASWCRSRLTQSRNTPRRTDSYARRLGQPARSMRPGYIAVVRRAAGTVAASVRRCT